LVSDTPSVLELFSPYVRDLGFAISTWALENEELLRTPGLAEALRSAGDRPTVDLASLVIPDLFDHQPELLAERREAEATQGLFLADEEDVIFGWADLSRLAQPDEASIARESMSTVVLLVSPSEPLLVEAANELLDTGRIIAASFVFAAPVEVPGVIVVDSLATDRDGFANSRANDLAERAMKLGVDLHRPGCLFIDDDRGAPFVTFELLARARRARALGRFPDEAPVFPVFYPVRRGETVQPLGLKIREIDAGRVALSLLSSQEDPPVVARVRKGPAQNAPGVSRRFRA
jgi:hypothetical protein